MKYLIYLLIFQISTHAWTQNSRANEWVLEAIPHLHANKHYEALQKLQKAQKEVDQHYAYKEQFLIWNNMGLVYFKMLDYKNATKYFQKAYELAKEHNKEEDVMTIINNLAVLHLKIDDEKQAQNYFEEALEISYKKGDLNKTAIYLINLSSILYEQNQLELSKKHLDEYTQISKEHIDQRTLINAEILKNNILLREGNYDSSIPSLKLLLQKCSEESYIDEKLKILVSLAVANRYLQVYDQSNRYVYTGLGLTDDPLYLIEFYDLLSKNALDQQKYKTAFDYKDSLIFYKHKLQSHINNQNIENTQLQFKLTKANLERQSEKELHQQSKKYYLIVIILCVLLFSLLLFSIYKKNQNSKQKQLLIEKNLRIKELELTQVEKSKIQLKEQLERYLNESEEIKKENASLEKKYIETSTYKDKVLFDSNIYQQTTKDILKELLNEILVLKTSSSNNELLNVIQKLKNHLMFVDALESRLDQEFYLLSEKIKLKYPKLTSQDLRMLNLIYLNISTKEMSKILYISPEGVRKRKERLKQKLDLNKEETISDFILAMK